ncbi:hypothetical protein RND71_012646 [Anisodus tanguticus]|uniref:Protein kinase domain-containing protein n=1 Tax=Anisodus tanguticus TaxID=243964 RepID=A0AAE1SG16_9SOLA|nr:hypothetical protein RND71_012646 [Anisodus tanguticus]
MGSSHGKFSTLIRFDSVESEEEEEILSTRRQLKLNPRLSRGVPKGNEGKIVAAGWPNWLVSVAGEAINGWLPRRVDTFECVDMTGQGTYRNVYKARDVLLNKVVAMKKLEALVASKKSSSLYLVFYCMEYDLKGIQEQKGVKFSEPEIKCYMHQLLKGLDHCHRRDILHGDITTSNLLVNKEGILKIADFGLYTTLFGPELGIPLTRKIVTLWYPPPELLLKSYYYVFGVELWGVGCVLGELFTGKPIMPGINEIEQLFKIFKLCGSPSDDYWKNCKSPKASIFKPRMPYKRQIQETFHDLPAAAVGLLDTLLSIEPEYRDCRSCSSG